MEALRALQTLSQKLLEGKGILEALPPIETAYPNANWTIIRQTIEQGNSLSDVLQQHPVVGLPPEEQRFLQTLVRAGEIGGLSEIAISRFVLHCHRKGREHSALGEFLYFIGFFISCGMGITPAVQIAPITTELRELQQQLLDTLRKGEEITPLFKNQLSEEQATLLSEAEQDGRLPDALLTIGEELGSE